MQNKCNRTITVQWLMCTGLYNDKLQCKLMRANTGYIPLTVTLLITVHVVLDWDTELLSNISPNKKFVNIDFGNFSVLFYCYLLS